MKKSIKIILIVAIALAVLLLGYFIYLIVSPESRPWYPDYNINENTNGAVLPNSNEATNQPLVNTNVNTGLPGIDKIAQGGLTLTNNVVNNTANASMSNDGQTISYYNGSDGMFYKVVAGSEPVALTDDFYKGAENVTFSPDSDKAIIEFPDGTNVMYDFQKKKQYSLPKEMEDFSFDFTGDRMAFKYMGQGEFDRWYATANPDGTGVNAVDLLGNNGDKVTIDWSPAGQVVGHWWEAKEGLKLEIKFLGEHDENFASTITEGIGFVGQWTTNGEKLLYSVSSVDSGLRPELWIVNASPGNIGRERINLGVRTWADKCTVNGSSTIAYCAVPINLDNGAGIARDVADDNVDEIYKIDLINNIRTKVAMPTNSSNSIGYTIEKMFINEDESELYFVENGNGSLNSINLK